MILAVRIRFTGTDQYSFMVWNLFLAAVPLLWSSMLGRTVGALKFWVFATLWLLFFPNAPYVVTDFIHLHPKSHSAVPNWYDVGMLANFGVLALMFGLLSMRRVHAALEQRLGSVSAAIAISGCAILSGFGIYLGRFLRWNSWDIVTRPHLLLADIVDRVIDPLSHPRTWVFTLMYGGTILLVYWFAYIVMRRKEREIPFQGRISVTPAD